MVFTASSVGLVNGSRHRRSFTCRPSQTVGPRRRGRWWWIRVGLVDKLVRTMHPAPIGRKVPRRLGCGSKRAPTRALQLFISAHICEGRSLRSASSPRAHALLTLSCHAECPCDDAPAMHVYYCRSWSRAHGSFTARIFALCLSPGCADC